jgi:DNA-binding Lrp family transcriptional regulator
MLTKKQRQILSELRSNSRQHLSKIACKLNMPNSTVFDNYKILSYYIKKYVTLVDFEKIGYSLKINFIFSIKNNEIIGFLKKQQNINSIYMVNNKKTLLAECFFRNISEAYEFKEKLQEEGCQKIDMRYIIEEIKKENFLANPEN